LVTQSRARAEVLQDSQPTSGKKMKALLLLIGIVVLAAGLFFMGQGSGLIRWPAESFMISAINWVYYGGGIAVVGLLLIVIARR
jgi:hypothetical protein